MEKIINKLVRVVGNTKIAEKTNCIDFDWPSEYPEPGQFIKLATKDKLKFPLMRPFSVVDCEYGAVSLLIREVGENTAFYRNLQKGDEIEVIGPLGKPLDLKLFESVEECIFVAGGIGLAPLLYIIRRIAEKNDKAANDSSKIHSLYLFYGEKEPKYLMNPTDHPFWIFLDRKTEIQRSLENAPKDIKNIRKGKVTDLLLEKLGDGKNSKRLIISCGPIPMLREVSRIAEIYDTDCLVSMEAIMGCGTGACNGCATSLKNGEMVQICKVGPFLDASTIDWDVYDYKEVVTIVDRKEVVVNDPIDPLSVTLIGKEGRSCHFKYPFGISSKGVALSDLENNVTDLSHVGFITTPSITLKKREGNPPPRIFEIPYGMANAISLGNKGVKFFCKEELPVWTSFGIPIIVSVAGNTPEEFTEVALEVASEVAKNKYLVVAIEANISCPNDRKKGKEIFAVNPDDSYNVIHPIRKVINDLILIAKLSPMASNPVPIGVASVDADADMLSGINTLLISDVDVKTLMARIVTGMGGASGPFMNFVAQRIIQQLFLANLGVPLVGIGGITDAESSFKLNLFGANVTAACTGFFSNPHLATDVVCGLPKLFKDHNAKNLQEMVGKVKIIQS